MSRVVVLGLDGATFTLLDPPLLARLPNLARLMSEGVHGPLRSTIHPLTPAAWTSAITGLNPGKHGIFDFRRRRPGSYTLEPVNARRRDGAPVWSLLSGMGRRVGVFNVPMTYPPEPVAGFMVSGMDTPSLESSFVYPAGLRAVLLKAVPGYQIDLDESTDVEDEYLARLEALAVAQQRALDVLIDQHTDVDFMMAVFVSLDRLYHAFWRELDPAQLASGSERTAKVRTLHERLLHLADDSLGRLWTWAGDEATIIVVSDHGFGPLQKDVYMNRFLLDAGLLSFADSPQATTFERLIDWERTRAYSFGFFGNINLNLRGREPAGRVEQGQEAEELKREIIDALHGLHDPDDGKPMVDAVYRREELYSGPHVGDAPDLLVVMRDYAYMTRDGCEGVHNRLVAPPMSQSGKRLVHTGNHRLDGVFMMAGPGVRAGVEISGARLMDLAPTVLYALGVPVPGIMDGHVLRQAFDSEHLQQRPPRRLLSVPPPVQNARQRELRTLAERVGELETAVQWLETDNRSAAVYAAGLESAIADKNQHIAALEQSLRRRDDEAARYQSSLFYRAFQRWQRLTGRGKAGDDGFHR